MVLPRNLTQYLDEFIKSTIHTLTNLSLFPIAKLGSASIWVAINYYKV